MSSFSNFKRKFIPFNKRAASGARAVMAPPDGLQSRVRSESGLDKRQTGYSPGSLEFYADEAGEAHWLAAEN